MKKGRKERRKKKMCCSNINMAAVLKSRITRLLL